MSDVGIVGGGMLGMTLAWRLRAAGHEVTIIEGAAGLGGLAAPETVGGFTWDRFYHVILLSDQRLRGLLRELELEDRLRWGTTRTGFYTDGRLYSLSSTLDFLRFPPLSLLDKLRLALTILRASRIRDGRPLERLPVSDWLTRWSGARTYARIWLPLLKNKLGENYRRASAAFIWAIIARMYAARRSGLKQEMFGYVEGGYDVVLRRFRERLLAAGVQFICGHPAGLVDSLPAAAGEAPEVAVELSDGTRLRFDDVILTVPCGRVARLCPGLSGPERERLERVTYQGIACLALVLKRPLAGYYVTNITEPWVPFTAVIEMTALVDRAHFNGHTLVYLPCYLTQEDPLWQQSDAEIRERFVAALERMYPDFRRADVVAATLSRAREVLAVSTLEYTARCLPPLETSLPGVWVANSAQIANGTLNVNETVGLAEQAAAALLPRLARGRAARHAGVE